MAEMTVERRLIVVFVEKLTKDLEDEALAYFENVKRRNLEAAEAWEAMASRLERTNAHRDANEAAREARAV